MNKHSGFCSQKFIVKANKRNILLVSSMIVLFSLVVFIGCGESQTPRSGVSTAAATKPGPSNQPKHGAMPAPASLQTFITYRYTDPMTNMEAFRLLIPKGWHAQGQITWSANPALPAQARFRFSNPTGNGEFNLFPTQAYFWTNNRLFLTTNPPRYPAFQHPGYGPRGSANGIHADHHPLRQKRSE